MEEFNYNAVFETLRILRTRIEGWDEQLSVRYSVSGDGLLHIAVMDGFEVIKTIDNPNITKHIGEVDKYAWEVESFVSDYLARKRHEAEKPEVEFDAIDEIDKVLRATFGNRLVLREE